MLFTDVSSERAVRALKKAGFTVVRPGKQLVLTDGTRLITVPGAGGSAQDGRGGLV